MADFESAFHLMMENEGGYVLHQVAGDKGGMTYAGISRKFNPRWEGWGFIDVRDFDHARTLVMEFYRQNYWGKIKGDRIERQKVAEMVFDYAVNAGVRVASRIAQVACGADPDGVIGERTLAAIDDMDEEVFLLRFALARVARRVEVVGRDRSQVKFLLGWLRRDLKGV